MELTPFAPAHAADAAALFVGSLDALRSEVPELPDALAKVDAVAERLSAMRGVAALEGGHLLGYITAWSPIERFRRTERRGAYSPEWAHGTVAHGRAAIYRALYRRASAAWAAEGCDVHAITLLASDRVGLDTWFWNGFGMGTVDGVRPTVPLGSRAPEGFSVRAARADDAPALATLDVEHARHYGEPPVFMAPRVPDAPDAWSAFLARPGNSAWLAEDAGGSFGFLRFDREFDGASVVESAAGVFISGAYVRPSQRQRGAATGLLDAALRHYAVAGLAYCAVDFEAFNPEAAAFWPRHFRPGVLLADARPGSQGPGRRADRGPVQRFSRDRRRRYLERPLVSQRTHRPVERAAGDLAASAQPPPFRSAHASSRSAGHAFATRAGSTHARSALRAACSTRSSSRAWWASLVSTNVTPRPRARRSASTERSRRGSAPFTSSAVPVASAAAKIASRSSSIGGRAPIMRAERWPIMRTAGIAHGRDDAAGLRGAVELEVVVHRGEAPVEAARNSTS